MFRANALDLDAVPLAGDHEEPHRLAGQWRRSDATSQPNKGVSSEVWR
jgi:hypothetical protein